MRIPDRRSLSAVAALALGCLVGSPGCSRAPRDAAPEPAPARTTTAPAVAEAPASPAVMAEPGSPREAAARATVAELRTAFQQALQSALASGGPEAAIVACREVAPGLAATVTAQGGTGIRVGRTSHKLRNPDHAPELWVQPALQAYAAGVETSPSLTVALPDGSLGYVEPIKVQAPCLACHGDPAQIPAGVKAKLAEWYPQDAATGFKEGDFRGLFWAVVPPES